MQSFYLPWCIGFINASKTKTLPGVQGHRRNSWAQKNKKNKPTLAIVSIHPWVSCVWSLYWNSFFLPCHSSFLEKHFMCRVANPATLLADALTKLFYLSDFWTGFNFSRVRNCHGSQVWKGGVSAPPRSPAGIAIWPQMCEKVPMLSACLPFDAHGSEGWCQFQWCYLTQILAKCRQIWIFVFFPCLYKARTVLRV